MIGLTLDTSHLYASIAISKNDKVMYFKKNKKVNKQAETLNLMIEEAMSDLRLSFSDLNYIAVATGPGKFTGLRPGMTKTHDHNRCRTNTNSEQTKSK